MNDIIKWIYRVVVGFCLLLLVFRLANWAVKHHAPALPPLPSPNGYVALLAAASEITAPPGDLMDLTPDQLRQLAGKNRPALDRARQALAMACAVPVQPTQAWSDRHADELMSLQQLAVALSVEDRVQMLDQHTNDAARCELDALHLANAMRQGGLILDGIRSLAVELIAVATLRARESQLDAGFCRTAALEIEALNARREMPETTLAVDRAWYVQRYGLINSIGGIFLGQADARQHTKYTQRSHEAIQREQILMLRLAARAYELDHGQRPADVAALVPRYLHAVPHDPDSGKEMQALPQTIAP